MSLVNVLPYYRGKLNLLGYKEHDDPFDADNVPESILDKQYQLEWGDGTTASEANQGITWSQPILCRLFIEGRRDSLETRDVAISRGETVLLELLNYLTNNSAGKIKNVALDSFSIESLSETNSNSMVVLINTTATIYLCAF